MTDACAPERYTFYTSIVKFVIAPVIVFALGHWHGRFRERKDQSKGAGPCPG